MSYQSFGFIAFSAIVVFLFYIVGKGPKRQQVVLALANLAFYAIAGVGNFLLRSCNGQNL